MTNEEDAIRAAKEKYAAGGWDEETFENAIEDAMTMDLSGRGWEPWCEKHGVEFLEFMPSFEGQRIYLSETITCSLFSNVNIAFFMHKGPESKSVH